jgi:hypothetical protein
MKYKIIFDGCHGHREGETVDFPAHIDTAYLLRVGAIKEVLAPTPVAEKAEVAEKDESKADESKSEGGAGQNPNKPEPTKPK